MKLKFKEYIEGIIISFLFYLLLLSMAGVVLIFAIKPIFVYLKTGEFSFIPSAYYVITVIKMTVACSATVSVIVFNINWFKED